MEVQPEYLNLLQEDLTSKIEQIEKLEGWLKYLWQHYNLWAYSFREGKRYDEISDYIKAMEGK